MSEFTPVSPRPVEGIAPAPFPVRQLGHVNLYVGDVGLARSVYLRDPDGTPVEFAAYATGAVPGDGITEDAADPWDI